MNAHTTTFILNNADYFVANLNNGGVRVGQKEVAAFDFPAEHAEYSKVVSLTEATVEAAVDAYFGAYLN